MSGGLWGDVPEDRLFADGRTTGPMPWIIAVMIFLTVLAAASGITLGTGASRLAGQVAGRLTVQVAEPGEQARAAAVAAIQQRLAAMPGVARVEPVPRDRLLAQLEPWLGDDAAATDLPVPALIDVDLVTDDADAAAATDAVTAAVTAISGRARVQTHAAFLQPVAALVRTISWIALAIIAMMALVTAGTVVLAARTALAMHRGTIEIMHMLGATDRQVTRMFQRRLTRDVAFGALLGLGGAVLAIMLVGQSFDVMASGLASSASLPGWGWLVLLLLPVAFVAAAWWTGRVTLMRSLERSL